MIGIPSTISPLSLFLFVLPLVLQCQPAVGQYVPRSPRDIAMRADSQSSSSRDIYIAGHDDFCLFGPAQAGPALSDGARNVVSWCNSAGHNTRMMPKTTLKGVTYIKAKNWVQVSGVGDFTQLNVKPGDWGGQFDSGEHKPEGAKVMGGSDNKEASSWVSMMTPDTFCFRACFGDASYCPTNFADKGCYFLLSNGVGFEGTFQSCISDDGQPPAKQGDKAPEWKDCTDAGATRGGSKGDDKEDDKAAPTTSWVGVPTCIPCTGAASSTPTPDSSATSAAAGTIQQGMTKVGGLVAGEEGSVMPSFISAPKPTSTPGSGGLILKRADETITKDGQCCFTTWTPTVIGAGAGPTASSSLQQSSSLSKGGAITGVNPSNVTNTALITKPSDGSKPAGNATVSGGGKNGTNSTGGNGSESWASRGVVWGVQGFGMGWAVGGVVLAAVWAAAGGWAVL